jgi:hypothetical protein
MPPQTAAHRRKIAAAVRKYHACARKHCDLKKPTTAKRPAGRPRKKTVTTKRPVGRPRKAVTVVTATKRPRGRPRKNMPTAVGRPVKKRGRPVGSRNKPKTTIRVTKGGFYI